jgi:hypothetical protein
MPQTQNITFDGGCANALPAPGACGGNVVGSWCYTGYCADGNVIFNAVTAACPTATFNNIAGTVRGTLGFTGTAGAGAVNRNVTWTLTGTITFPQACRMAAGSCAAIQAALGAAFLTATCTNSSGGGCTCALANNDTDNGAGSYTTDGGLLYNGTRTFEYCVQSNTLRYRELGSMALEQGVIGTVQR